MRTFQDAAGRTWTIAVNVDAIKRVKSLLNEDMLDVEGFFPRLLIDPILLCDVLFAILKPQADAANVSDVDFARAMAGDAIAHARTALVAEYVDFFPNPNQREILHEAMKKHNELQATLTELIKKKIKKAQLPPEIQASFGEISIASQEPSA